MSAPNLQSLATVIRTARENKGLTQRTLGERVGIPQSHISKIERGTVDLQTSNLMQIARALDLEVALVPRTVLPALETLSSARSPQEPVTNPYTRRRLALLRTSVLRARQQYPAAQTLQRLAKMLSARNWIDVMTAPEFAQAVLQSIKPLQESLRKLHQTPPSNRKAARKLLAEIETAEQRLKDTRNALVHGQIPLSRTPTPAYSLDEEVPGDEVDHG